MNTVARISSSRWPGTTTSFLRRYNLLPHRAGLSTRAVYEVSNLSVQPFQHATIAEQMELPRIDPAQPSLSEPSTGLESRLTVAVKREMNKRKNFAVEIDHHRQQQQLRVLAGAGDMKLGDFMEEVKTELWQYGAMPLRRRFRIQSLLRWDFRNSNKF